MKRITITPDNEEHWLKLRDEDITSTMMSALFDVSPYNTRFDIYHNKKNGVELPFKMNERIEIGSRMEEFAGHEVLIKHGWEGHLFKDYIRIPELKMGSSFDFEVICPERGKGILEIKAVDYFQYKEKWEEDEAPPHIEIQLQHQLMVAGPEYKWGVIAVWTGIYDHHLIIRERDEEMMKVLEAETKKFWKQVEDGEEPDIDLYRDCDLVVKLCDGDQDIDLSDNENLLMKYHRLNREVKEAQKELKETKTQIANVMRLENAKHGFSKDYEVKVITVKDTPATLITADMVGNEIGGRDGYNRIAVKYIGDKK